MSYANFIPTVWNESIERELERLCVFAEDCNRSYEGSVKSKGESVKILGVGKPTIKSIAKTDKGKGIDGPEKVEDTSVIMTIDQIRYFNYMIDDIDKAQAVNGVMDVLNLETSEGLANEVDKHIASLVDDSNVAKLFKVAPLVTTDKTAGEGYVLDILDTAIEKLYENDVKATTEIVCTVSPKFFTRLKKAYAELDTDNSKILKNGRVGMYGNVTIKMSNNVHKSKDGSDNIMIRTKRAVAYVNPLTHTEAYRPENEFADAVKGFILFGAKVVRPKEILNINVKYA